MKKISKVKNRKIFLFPILILSVFLLALFFSYRLLAVPPGLTVDEAAFGYNAVLLSRTAHDQNGRFLPFFVLSIDGKDWRQPVTQYFITLFFKIFGPSYFKLRFTSVLITLFSLLLLVYLGRLLSSSSFSFLAGFVFLTTPLVMIQSHLALDNIMPIPFVILWLLALFFHQKTGKRKFLFWAGFVLGISFYSYKAMRAVVPVWCLLTVGYLLITLSRASTKNLLSGFKSVLIFSLGVLPFFVIIPLLEWKYAGAVFDRQQPSWDSVYTAVYPYLASFDPSFLFVKGDATIYHSTGRHGMMLLASLPLFLIGIFSAVRRKGFWLLVLSAFFTAPALFGLVNSVHRASRLMVLIPLYALICGLGGSYLWQGKILLKRLFLGLILILSLLNYFDFLGYYWYTYPKVAREWFSEDVFRSYLTLSGESKNRNLTPYIDRDVYLGDGESAHFFEAAYFEKPLLKWANGDQFPQDGILMTQRQEVAGFKSAQVRLPEYYLLVKSF